MADNGGVDSLAESLARSFSVAGDYNSTDAPHPRWYLFKQKTSTDQTARRQKFLADLKQRRQDFSLHARRLAQGMSILATVAKCDGTC